MSPGLKLRYAIFPSRLGPVLVAEGEGGVRALHFPADDATVAWVGCRFGAEMVSDDRALAPVRREVEEYLAGRLRRFSCRVDLSVGTPFQRKVWEAMLGIPYGQTRTYAEVARAIGHPASYRAVGGASHSNPVPIIVPCHRVVGSDGSMVGYGGDTDGGRRLKRSLLEMEGALG